MFQSQLEDAEVIKPSNDRGLHNRNNRSVSGYSDFTAARTNNNESEATESRQQSLESIITKDKHRLSSNLQMSTETTEQESQGTFPSQVQTAHQATSPKTIVFQPTP